ncbi:MAG TPA: DUF1801 domain-containing protein [Candidatus Limnocylindrales bacterium]|nr:DUF1801 domain-containing protein [Candidatus Limnocylindrales bacterium]
MPTREKIWSEAEQAAVKAAARERKAAAGRDPAQEREDGLNDLRASLAKMPPDDRAMGERLHEVISGAVPGLVPKTYYGMPAYATEGKDGKTICFYKAKSKFRVRYSTVGFQPDAHLDDGDMWPTEFAVIRLTLAVEGRIAALVKQAAG